MTTNEAILSQIVVITFAPYETPIGAAVLAVLLVLFLFSLFMD